MNAVYNRVNNK